MRLMCALVVVMGAQAAVAERISLGAFKGSAPVKVQVTEALCAVADCFVLSKVQTRGKVDAAKLKAQHVAGVVSGTVARNQLTLEVVTEAAPPARQKFALKKGKLTPATLTEVLQFVRDSLPPVVAVQPKPAAREDDVLVPPPTATAKRPAVVEPPPTIAFPKELPQEEPPPPVAPKPKEKASKRAPFLVADLGVDVLNRRLAYDGLTTGNLRGYELPVFPALAARVSVAPLALSRTDALAGLGFELGLGLSPALRSTLVNVAPFPTAYLRFDAGARFRLEPAPSFAISPFLGFRLQRFSVAANADGERINGLPDVSYLGLRVGAEVELQLIKELLVLHGRVAALPVFSAADVLSADYFARGFALGVEGQVGVAVHVIGPLWGSVTFEATHVGLGFQTVPADTYRARGAADTYLGGNVGARLVF